MSGLLPKDGPSVERYLSLAAAQDRDALEALAVEAGLLPAEAVSRALRLVESDPRYVGRPVVSVLIAEGLLSVEEVAWLVRHAARRASDAPPVLG